MVGGHDLPARGRSDLSRVLSDRRTWWDHRRHPAVRSFCRPRHTRCISRGSSETEAGRSTKSPSRDRTFLVTRSMRESACTMGCSGDADSQPREVLWHRENAGCCSRVLSWPSSGCRSAPSWRTPRCSNALLRRARSSVEPSITSTSRSGPRLHLGRSCSPGPR